MASNRQLTSKQTCAGLCLAYMPYFVILTFPHPNRVQKMVTAQVTADVGSEEHR